jgi:hypothetical protein
MSDQRAALTYSSYLALDEVLAERPRTDEHDELLFIVISTRSTSCGSTSSSTLCCPVERPEDEREWLASLQLGAAPLVGPMRGAPFASTWHACWTLRAEAAPATPQLADRPSPRGKVLVKRGACTMEERGITTRRRNRRHLGRARSGRRQRP